MIWLKMFFKKEDKLKQEVSELKESQKRQERDIDFLKQLILKSSIGNKGVQTDSQHILNSQTIENTADLGTTIAKYTKETKDLEVVEVVNLMNDFKDSIKRKFKSLTDQEFFVFCLIYSLEEQLGAVSYRDIALKAGLTESVIRDYVRHLFSKGIPILKERKNNKLILLKVSPELKSLVSLDALVAIHDPYSVKRSIMAENVEALRIANKIR